MDRDSFVYHISYFKNIPRDQKLDWIERVERYVQTGEKPAFDSVDWMCVQIWENIQGRIDSDLAAYDKRCEYQRAYNARRKKQLSAPVQNVSDKSTSFETFQNISNVLKHSAQCDMFQNVPLRSNSEFKSDSEFKSEFEYEFKSESEFKESRDKSTRFTPPSLQDVDNYIKEKGYVVSPEAFINFYEAKGWMIGKNKMKDWKAAVRNWVSRDKQEHPEKQVTLKHYEDDTW